MYGLKLLIEHFPQADYYFLADQDTVVMPNNFRRMLFLLENHILPSHADLYVGHKNAAEKGIPPFIMTGGGALLRGGTLRKLQGSLETLSERSLRGDLCWYHLDWVLGKSLKEKGVRATAHEAFQQYSDRGGCSNMSVSCHPVRLEAAQQRMIQELSIVMPDKLNSSWAAPCPDRLYSNPNMVGMCRRHRLKNWEHKHVQK